MLFGLLLLLAASGLASAGAFFSIYGLTKLFTASFLSIVLMGISLEFGKLTAASFLYRYWKKINWFMKAYLSIALLALMCITSLGIFGYLSYSYQKDSVPLAGTAQQITFYKQQYANALARKNQINNQIASLPNDYVTGRQRLIKTFKAENIKLSNEISETSKKIELLSEATSKQSLKIGPIIYVANTLKMNPDKVIFYFILLIIFVFDPLAVSLTVAANMVFLERKSFKKNNEIWPHKDMQNNVIEVQERTNLQETAERNVMKELHENSISG
jgi:flagellar basal body-associated protein FliL